MAFAVGIGQRAAVVSAAGCGVPACVPGFAPFSQRMRRNVQCPNDTECSASRIVSARVRVATEGPAVTYDSPEVGEVSFGWDGPLRIAGRSEPLGDYARFDNPYCHAPHGSGRYVIDHAGRRLVIDFPTNEYHDTP